MGGIKIITSWDDGSKYDIKLARLLKKYGLPGIFYIPDCCELSEEQILELSRDFEIGGHTVNHLELPQLQPELQEVEIENNKIWLESFLHSPLRTFAYPSGKYNPASIEAVKKAGYSEARKVCWGKRMQHTLKPLELEPTAFIHPDKSKFGGKNWDVYAKEQLKGVDYFHLWGHSHEVEKYGLWAELEKFFKYLSKKICQNPNGKTF